MELEILTLISTGDPNADAIFSWFMTVIIAHGVIAVGVGMLVGLISRS